jgi:hypothetical protein
MIDAPRQKILIGLEAMNSRGPKALWRNLNFIDSRTGKNR